MTTYYVGSGGNDGNSGTSWANRKLTLNGAEDIPVVAGDTVYVGPGTYREMLTVDVSGSAGGGPITYIGDYTGANTDGTGGIVRITGSDDDQTATRTQCIASTSYNYRTWKGFVLDTATLRPMSVTTSCDNWIVEDCSINNMQGSSGGIYLTTPTNLTIRRCVLLTGGTTNGIYLTSGSTQDNTNCVIQNCIISGWTIGVRNDRIGGVTIKNCLILNNNTGARVFTALTVSQTMTVNNCLVMSNAVGLRATVTGELVEDYNGLYGNTTARTNVSTGSNSVSYPSLLDPRWWMELTLNNGTLVTPFDLSADSAYVELNSGTGAPSTDARGTSVQGTYREWGAFEYDSTLDLEAGAAAGGNVNIIRGKL